jgi:hypothetical protein
MLLKDPNSESGETRAGCRVLETNEAIINLPSASARLAFLRCSILLWLQAGLLLAAQAALISVNPRVVIGASQLKLGVTHTQVRWENGDPVAVARARDLLRPVADIQNQSIMGWGAGRVLQPSPGAAYDFSSLDERIDLMRSLAGEMVLTLCTAPGWMKISGQDWNMNDRVADNRITDFANLCQAIAQRYPDVHYFVVWNEMKGYWNSSIVNSDGSQGNWDYVKYTALYNAVYRAIKSVRPDAEVGGFYLPVTGDASSTRGYSGPGTQIPLIPRDLDCLNYWLANKAGADFISVDRWLAAYNNPNTLSEADQMALTWTYQAVLQAIRAKTSLPIWYSEYYTASYDAGASQFLACAEASIYSWMIKGAGSSSITALLWNPSEGEAGVAHYLFSSTSDSAGAQPTPHYAVFRCFHDYFGPGTQLCQATTSDPAVEVLASDLKTLLINKLNSSQNVTVNGTTYSLPGYAVTLVDTPHTPPRLSLSVTGGQLQLTWPGWATSYTPYTANNLDSSNSWQPLIGPFMLSNGVFSLTLTLPATNGLQFFQLRSP